MYAGHIIPVTMIRQIKQNWFFTAAFLVVALLHLLLLIPAMRQAVVNPKITKSIQIQLNSVQPIAEAVEPATAPPVETRIDRETNVATPDPMEVPAWPAVVREPEPPPVVENPPAGEELQHRILARQFDYRTPVPLFGTAGAKDGELPDFFFRSRPVLEEVLNAPSLQLPFRDTRIYLVDSYSTGLAGEAERFFDAVTVPFGWTTKGNTRIQCVWVLIISGCSWGHVSLFHEKAKRRSPDQVEGDQARP